MYREDGGRGVRCLFDIKVIISYIFMMKRKNEFQVRITDEDSKNYEFLLFE